MSAITKSLHGPTYELTRANRWGGPMYWNVIQWRTLGVLVYGREITATGAGQWELIAIALDPIRYVRDTSGPDDLEVK